MKRRSVNSCTGRAAPSTGNGYSTTTLGDDDNETGYRFGAHSFQPSEYVSLSDNAGDTSFRVITVSPVV
jgi:hypothetical protein